MLQVSVVEFVKSHRIAFYLCGIICSTAVILPACGDAITNNGAAQRELGITKTGVVSGQNVTYTITVTNNGAPGTGAVNVVVSDVVQTAPAGSTFTSAVGATCTGSIAGYNCTVSGIQPGASQVFTLVLAVPSGTSGGVENCATLPSDSISTNNHSCAGNSVVAPASPSSITIVKDAAPNSAQNFDFTMTNVAAGSFFLDDDTDPAVSNQKVFSNLAAGTYTITEATMAGWSLDAITCTSTTGVTVSAPNRSVTIVLAAGVDITCTFLNRGPTTGSITIVKDATPNNAQDFTFTTNKAGIPSFILDDDADATQSDRKVLTGLVPDTYTFTESVTAGWTLSTLACTPSANTTSTVATRTASVTLAAGDSIVCTFTNVVAPAPTITSITPAQPVGSTSAQPITIGGANFLTGASVTLRNVTTSETFANQAIGSLTSSQIVINPVLGAAATSQNWTVQVTNPDGIATSQAPFVVTSPTPAITVVATNPSPARTGTVVITLTGTNFSPTEARIVVTAPGACELGCVIPNGSLTTKTSTTVAGPINLTTAGTYSVRVQNAVVGPTGATGPQSNTLTFPVTN